MAASKPINAPMEISIRSCGNEMLVIMESPAAIGAAAQPAAAAKAKRKRHGIMVKAGAHMATPTARAAPATAMADTLT
jgi:hypothetical protein